MPMEKKDKITLGAIIAVIAVVVIVLAAFGFMPQDTSPHINLEKVDYDKKTNQYILICSYDHCQKKTSFVIYVDNVPHVERTVNTNPNGSHFEIRTYAPAGKVLTINNVTFKNIKTWTPTTELSAVDVRLLN